MDQYEILIYIYIYILGSPLGSSGRWVEREANAPCSLIFLFHAPWYYQDVP